jgi:hypothetical protein
VDQEDDDDANDLDADARNADRLRRNRYGMGGNQNRGNNDPFSKKVYHDFLCW